ncbi:MAG: hypothetical protein V4724_20960 [Pseudomonadota bacterium]
MPKIKLVIAGVLCAVVLAGCGGGSGEPPSTAGSESPQTTLLAGQSVTLSAGQTINVPKGTIVNVPGGNTVNFAGDNSQVNTSAGAIVTAPASATGPADNIVVAK